MLCRVDKDLFKEVWMLHSCFARDLLVRIVHQQFLQQIHGIAASQGLRRYMICNGPLSPLRKFGIAMRKPRNRRSNIRRGATLTLKDFKQLINVGQSGEQGHTSSHFRKDTTNAPDIHGSRIAIGTQQQVGSAIPQSYDFKSIGTVQDGR